jgi:hypothetical protein
MDALEQTIIDIDYAIGDRVNTLMHRHGYTRKAFGLLLGLGQSAMSLKVGGHRPWTAMEVKVAADVLKVNVAVLYGDEAMPEPTRPATVTTLDTSKNAVGPTGLDPVTSTVEYGRLATVTPLRRAI